MGLGLGSVVLAATCVSGRLSAPEPSAYVEAYLTRVGFSTSEIAQMRAGSVIARVLPQKDDNAVFVVGVARIEATEEAFVEGIRSGETFRGGEGVIETGRFGTPPSVDDLQLLAFDRQDLEDLRKCRVGDCDIKLEAETIALAKRVDWSASDSRAQAAQVLKLALVARVKGYLERGAAGMAVYHDKEAPRSTAVEFAKLLESAPRLIQDDAFQRYLLEFPRATLPNVENFVYWSKEKIRKPVVSVVHVCLQRVERAGEATYFIAFKHIYDSHFFPAYAEFLTVIPYSGSAQSFYLVHSVRARVDRPRWFGGMLMGKIKREMRSALSRDLLRTKRRLEARSEN
jgi:hypothetical protein